MLVAQIVDLAHVRDQLKVVVPQFRQHVERRHVLGVIVQDALQVADLADRPQGRAADLAHALRDGVGGGKNLVALLVQQPLLVDTFDEPQPDLVILREALGSRKPRVGDCLVVIEVSDSTYATDVGIKLPAYLAAGVPEVWIINISDHATPMVEVWTPGAEFPAIEAERPVWRPAGAGQPFTLALAELFRPV